MDDGQFSLNDPEDVFLSVLVAVAGQTTVLAQFIMEHKRLLAKR